MTQPKNHPKASGPISQLLPTDETRKANKARMVKSAVQELPPGAKEALVIKKPGATKAEQRRLIDDTIGQLLVLLSKKASHGVLVSRVEALHGHIHALFGKPRP